MKVPGNPHPGPYATEIAEGVAAAGFVTTNVFTLDEIEFGSLVTPFQLIPDVDAPNGPSPDYSSGPVIPNEVFPITWTQNLLWEGKKIFSEDGRTTVEALTDLGSVFTNDGQTYDYSRLNYSHIPFFTFADSAEFAG